MEQTTDTQETAQIKTNHNNRNRKFAIIGLVLTLLAWCTMPLLDRVSLILTVLAIIFSAIGCRIPPGFRRNIAITSLIAASSLLLAIIVIWICLIIFV